MKEIEQIKLKPWRIFSEPKKSPLQILAIPARNKDMVLMQTIFQADVSQHGSPLAIFRILLNFK